MPNQTPHQLVKAKKLVNSKKKLVNSEKLVNQEKLVNSKNEVNEEKVWRKKKGKKKMVCWECNNEGHIRKGCKMFLERKMKDNS